MGKPSRQLKRGAKPKTKPGRESPQLKRLRTRVRNLESKLSDSVPKQDLEALKGILESQLSELQGELARSVPKSDADSLSARIRELEGVLGESVPRLELEEASRKMRGLEARNQTLEVGNEELESQVRELKSRVQGLELKESSQTKEIEGLKRRVTEVDTRAKEKTENIMAVTKRARYTREDRGYWMGDEDWRELRGLIAPLSGEDAKEHKFQVSGKCAGCGMTELDFQQALSILDAWPEDSEKKERIAELKTCKNDRLAKSSERKSLLSKQEP
jgi:uncharacterized coiled-coil protein SlyX